MWVNLRSVVGVLSLCMVSSVASAAVIADFRGDFQMGSPRSGWAYLWNANGPVGNFGHYVPLTPVAETVSYVADSGVTVLQDRVIPGPGITQDPSQVERAAILAYTVSAADIAANGNVGYIDDYLFGVALSSTDIVTASIYVNNNPIIIGLPFPAGFVYDRSAPDAYPMPLGLLNPGDTVYVAIGSGPSSAGDIMDIAYTIKLVPEPAAMSVLGMLAVGLLGRRHH